MEDDVGVSKLVELIFVKEFGIPTERKAFVDSTIPACLLANDFPLKLRQVVLTKEAMIAIDWKSLFESFNYTAFTEKGYLETIILCCQCEYYRNSNVFESFIGICSMVKHFCSETYRLTKMNFSDMNPDVVLKVYNHFLKMTFIRRGGFLRFIDNICRHKYLAWNFDINDLAYLDDPSIKVSVETAKKLETRARKERHDRKLAYNKSLYFDVMQVISASLAEKVLATKANKHSTSTKDPNLKVDTAKQFKKAKKLERETSIKTTLKCKHLQELSQRGQDSNSDCKIVLDDIASCEKIIQEVINHNRLKGSSHAKSEQHIQEISEEILQSLKNKIQAVIRVLEEHDNE